MMFHLKPAVILLALLCSVEVYTKGNNFVVRIEKVEVETNPNLANMTITYSNAQSTVNIDYNLYQDIAEGFFIRPEIKLELQGKGKYRTIMRSERIDLCNYAKRPQKPGFMKVLLNSLGKNANLVICPITKGHYTLPNFAVDADTLPFATPMGRYLVILETSLKQGSKFNLLYKLKAHSKVLRK